MSEPFNLGDLDTYETGDPAAPALIDLRLPASPRIVSHFELDAVADHVAATLAARNLPPGAGVAILSANRWEYLAAYFGIMRAGFVAVPVNVRLPADIIAYVLEVSSTAFAYTDDAHAHLAGAGMPHASFDEPAFATLGAPFETVRPAPGAVAQILFTSGSTGRPKAVPLSHEGQLWALSQSRKLSLGQAPHRHVVVQPLFHMNGLFLSKTVFAAHGSMVMLPAFNSRTYLQAIADWQVTAISAVPTMVARALKETDLLASLDLSRIRLVRVGSAPVTQAFLDRVRDTFPSAALSNGYGTTEAGPFVFGPHPDGIPTPVLSPGYPHPAGEAKLVGGDPDQGVLWMRNPAVMTGYIGLPEVSARVLNDGWYISGDVFRRDENGFMYFVGRADDMFVCSGENIYPADVEKMLERHPAIHQVCVVPLPDDERGQMPVAFVVPRAELTAAEVKTFALANGPAYAHPRRVAFIAELPWAGTNKLDRNFLITRARELERDGGWAA